jgi:hypothetical protein
MCDRRGDCQAAGAACRDVTHSLALACIPLPPATAQVEAVQCSCKQEAQCLKQLSQRLESMAVKLSCMVAFEASCRVDAVSPIAPSSTPTKRI